MSNNNINRATDNKTCSATTPEREEMQMLRRNALSTSPELSILSPGSQFLLRRSRKFLLGFTLSQTLPPFWCFFFFFSAHSELIGNCLQHSASQSVTLQSPIKTAPSAWSSFGLHGSRLCQQRCALGSSPVPGACECSRTEYLPDRHSIFRLGGSPVLPKF